MTTILPSSGNHRFYYDPNSRFAALDTSDFGQQDSDVGADPADVNEVEERPEQDKDEDGTGGLPIVSKLADLEEGGGLDNDADDLEGQGDEDTSDGSLGGINNAYASLHVADSQGRGGELIAPHDSPTGAYNAHATEFSGLHPTTQAKIHKSFKDAGMDHEHMVQNIMAVHRHAQMHNPEALKNGMSWYDRAHKAAGDLAQKHGVSIHHAAGVIAATSPQAHWDHSNLPTTDYYLGKAGPKATKAGAHVDLTDSEIDNAHEFAMKDYGKKKAAYDNALAKHQENPKKPHPGDAPEVPKRMENGKKFSEMGHSEAGNAIYNQAQHDDVRVPEHLPGAYTQKGERRKVIMKQGTSGFTKAVRLSRGEHPDQVLGGHKVRSFYNNIMDPQNKHGHNDVTIDTHAVGLAMNSTDKDRNIKLLQGASHKASNVNGAHAYIADAYRDAHKRLQATGEMHTDSHPHQLQAQTWEHWRSLSGADESNTKSRHSGFQGNIEHNGGAPMGWKPGYKATKEGSLHTAAKNQDPWINPMGGPYENPDLEETPEEFEEAVRKENEKNSHTGMIRWAMEWPNLDKGWNQNRLEPDGEDPDEDEDEGYDPQKDYDKDPSWKPVQNKTSMIRWALNVGEDPRFEQKSEENNAQTRAVNKYNSDADEAQDKFYFGYDDNENHRQFEKSDDVPTYMSAVPLAATAMVRWGEQLNSTNLTGTIFTDYDPSHRATSPLGNHLTTLDRAAGGHPDDSVKIHRGVPHGVSEINPGDYVTTNHQLAKDYAGNGRVLTRSVRKGDILADPDEWEGEEHIYRPGADKEIHSATKHDEPEPALPSTDGADEEVEKTSMIRWSVQNASDEKAPSQLWDDQHSNYSTDPMSSYTPKNMTDPNNSYRETVGIDDSDRKILSDQPLNEPGTRDDPYEDLGSTTANSKLAAKVFTPSEQLELINEMGKASNLGLLDIAETHYALLDSDEEE